MSRFRHRLLRGLAALTAGGTSFVWINGCSPQGLTNILSNFNPCTTIIACDATQFEFLTSGYEGPGVNVEIDPFCTYPPYCTAAEDPIFGGLAGP